MRDFKKASLIFSAFVFVCVFEYLYPSSLIAYRSDPISSSIITALIITGASMAANYAYQYYTITRRRTTPSDPGKWGDIRVTGNEYGAFIPRVYGTARVGGFSLLDATEIVHSTTTTPGQPGGKGAPKPPTPGEIRHTYTTTLAVGICEGLGDLAPDFAITRIWAGTEVIYDTTVTSQGDASYEAERPGNTLSGGAIAVADADASGGSAVLLPQNGQVIFNNVLGATGGSARYEFYLKSTVVNSVELNFIGVTFTGTMGNTGGVYALATVSGVIPMTAGFTNTIRIKNLSATPFTLDRIIVRGTGQGTGVVNEFIDASVGADDRTDTVPVFGELPERDADGVITGTILAGGRAGIRIYTGTETQNPDSALVALHGAANTPAYRGTAYVVFDSYVLNEPFIPNFTFEVATGLVDIDTIVQDLYSVVNVTSAKLDVTALAGLTLEDGEGFVISSRDQAAQWLEQLQTVYQFDCPEVDGKAKAVLRNGSSVATITGDELRGHWEGEQAPDFEVLIEDVDEQALPRILEVGYMDAHLDYHNNVQQAMRLSGNSVEPQTVNLPLVLSATHARRLAETLLYQRHQESRTFTFTTGPKYQKLHPGDVVTLALTNATHVCRIVEHAWSIMGPQKFTAVRAQASVYNQNITGASGDGYEAPVIPSPAAVKGLIIDTALLRPEDGGDGTQPVVYVAPCMFGDGVYRGAFAHKEVPKDSGSYETRLAIDGQAFIGVANGVLGTIDPTVWDRASEFGVSFYPTTVLESITEQQALDNLELNLLAIGSMDTGWYIAQFTTVVAEAPAEPFRSRYVFSGLLWDRFATGAPASGSSVEGLDVVILNAAVKPMRVELEDWNRERNYKFTSPGQSTADVPALPFTLQANSLKPPAPTDIRGDRDSDDNLLVEWRRRSRVAQNLRDFADVPLAEEKEEYIIEVMDGADVVRTMHAITGMSLPALFESNGGTKFTDINVNTLSALSGVGTVAITARSFQKITASGNFVEGTLSIGGTEYASLGLISPSKDWRNGASPDYEVRLTNLGLGDDFQLFVMKDGVTVHTEDLGDAETMARRVRITLSGTEVRFYIDWTGTGTPPFYVSPVAPSLPFHAWAQIAPLGPVSVEKVVMTTWPDPKTIYTAAQMVEDGFTPGDPITMRIYEASAIVGRGHYAEVEI